MFPFLLSFLCFRSHVFSARDVGVYDKAPSSEQIRIFCVATLEIFPDFKSVSCGRASVITQFFHFVTRKEEFFTLACITSFLFLDFSLSLASQPEQGSVSTVPLATPLEAADRFRLRFLQRISFDRSTLSFSSSKRAF